MILLLPVLVLGVGHEPADLALVLGKGTPRLAHPAENFFFFYSVAVYTASTLCMFPLFFHAEATNQGSMRKSQIEKRQARIEIFYGGGRGLKY